jgi:Concanavalin A-like lectin/glucanases superfamily
MPKLGLGIGLAGIPYKRLSTSQLIPTIPTGNIYTSPTVGSAITIESLSPFTGGGFSYLFTESDNSFLDLPADQSWAVGTGDFTIEWFQRQTTTSGFQRVMTVDDFPNMAIGVSVETGTFYYWANNTFRYSSSGATSQDIWYHWAIVRSSGVTRVYRDGALRGTQITDTNNITNTTDPLTIGNENAGNRIGQAGSVGAYRGYITNFRWVKGLAVYTGNFTVPTSPLTLVAAANPYGGSNTVAIPEGFTKLLLIPTT